MHKRLVAMRDDAARRAAELEAEPTFFDSDIEGVDELLDEILAEGGDEDVEPDTRPSAVNFHRLGEEIDESGRLISLGRLFTPTADRARASAWQPATRGRGQRDRRTR